MATVKKTPAKASAKTAKAVHEFTKVNSAVKKAEEKLSSKDNLLKRIGARLDATKAQSEMALNAVLASIQETTVAKGSLNLTGFAKFESVLRPASEGTIQFGEKKGEKWTKDEHNAIKVSNLSAFWNEIANDDSELTPLDSLVPIWTDEEEADEIEDEVEEVEETPAKKAPAKKAPVKKAPAKKAPVKK